MSCHARLHTRPSRVTASTPISRHKLDVGSERDRRAFGLNVALPDQALTHVFGGHYAVDSSHLAIGGFFGGAFYASGSSDSGFTRQSL